MCLWALSTWSPLLRKRTSNFMKIQESSPKHPKAAQSNPRASQRSQKGIPKEPQGIQSRRKGSQRRPQTPKGSQIMNIIQKLPINHLSGRYVNESNNKRRGGPADKMGQAGQPQRLASQGRNARCLFQSLEIGLLRVMHLHDFSVFTLCSS